VDGVAKTIATDEAIHPVSIAAQDFFVYGPPHQALLPQKAAVLVLRYPEALELRDRPDSELVFHYPAPDSLQQGSTDSDPPHSL
jgi:hypothetical protein